MPFTNTTTDQLRELFEMFYAMYDEAPNATTRRDEAAAAAHGGSSGSQPTGGVRYRTRTAASAELRATAAAFASRVPAGRFTAAEIMGYMLKHETAEAALASAAMLAEGGAESAEALVTLPNALRTGRSGAGETPKASE